MPVAAAPSHSSLAARQAVLATIRAYQLLLSPLAGGACRFVPSCSEYALEAVARHGARRGVWLAVKRLARCHPLGAHGLDPVPGSLPHAGHSDSITASSGGSAGR